MGESWVYNFPARFVEGDVVGCQVTLQPTPSICFARNGVMGTPLAFSPSNVHPTLHASEGCRIRYNFGASDFVYNPQSGEPPTYKH